MSPVCSRQTFTPVNVDSNNYNQSVLQLVSFHELPTEWRKIKYDVYKGNKICHIVICWIDWVISWQMPDTQSVKVLQLYIPCVTSCTNVYNTLHCTQQYKTHKYEQDTQDNYQLSSQLTRILQSWTNFLQWNNALVLSGAHSPLGVWIVLTTSRSSRNSAALSISR